MTTASSDNGFRFVKLGSVRPSQMTHTFGVGSIVEMPFVSVVVRDHTSWNIHDRKDGTVVSRVVTEPRLLAAVRHDLGPQIVQLRTPPVRAEQAGRKPNSDLSNWVGAEGMPFPRWYRCTRCNALTSLDQGVFDWPPIDAFRPHDAGAFHRGCAGHDRRAIPVRAVVVCPAGHMDDFPWVEYAHRDNGWQPCSDPTLVLIEGGYAERATDLKVKCQSCDASEQTLDMAFGVNKEKFLPQCRGYFAHSAQWDPRGGCDFQARAIMVGASNLWFPLRRTVLTIPEAVDEAEAFVFDHYDTLKRVPSLEALGEMADPDHYNPYQPLIDTKATVEAVWDALERLRTQDEKAEDADPDEPDERGHHDIQRPEWESLNRDTDCDDADFTLRIGGVPTSQGWSDRLGDARQLTRLREVSALTGFTRLEAFDPDEDDPGPRRAPLSPLRRTRGGGYRMDAAWVPVAESRGEGIFVPLDEDTVAAWENTATDHPRLAALRTAHRAWRTNRGGRPTDSNTPQARYVLLHTFSHLLINELALHAGYNAASIKERIYSRPPNEAGGPMAGVLLYTAESDSEGTLGGLVSLGQPDLLGRLIDDALDRAGLCPTDPFCAEHIPTEDEAASHGAACHSCLFLPETSCENSNRHLDRSFVVTTLASDDDLAYFPSP